MAPSPHFPLKQSAAALFLLGFPFSVSAEKKIEFNRDVRPILADRCFHCHGPDKETREADLRLDVEEDAKREFGGYFAIDPGNAADSEVYYRIMTDDDNDLMPPPESKREMTDEEKEIIRRWIDEGAEYEDHWSLVPPTQVTEVGVSDESWISNEVDQFILNRLDEHGLKPSEEADRRTLIRRLSFDLTGLPPTPEEVEAYVNDASDDAYETVVDRLLKSLRFGEHWARSWLDLARYADSNGFQADQLRDSWAYRDWVINALNSGMPFDQFTIEQLAGDLLPNATIDQKIATGFHRTVTCNVEAGVHPEENRTNQVVDRVNTTATVWLGTTMGCVQCHDHKYDPFTTKDYYGLFAFFNNTPLEVDNGGKGVSFDFVGPKMDLPIPAEQAAKRKRITAHIQQLASKRKQMMTGSEGREQWEMDLRTSLKNRPEWTALTVDRFRTDGGEDFRLLEDKSILLTGNVPGTVVYTIDTKPKLKQVSAIRVEALTHDELPGTGPGRGDDERPNFILSELNVMVHEKGQNKGREVVLNSVTADYSQPNWEVEKSIDGNRKTGWAIGQQFGKPHWAVYRLKEPLLLKEGATLRFSLDQNYGRGRTIGRVRLSAMDGDPLVDELSDDLLKILEKNRNKLSKVDIKALDDLFVESNPALKKLDAEMSKAKRDLNALKIPSTLVMIEMEESRDTHIMNRGVYLDKGEKVVAATPEVLPPMDQSLPKDRLGLAKWLVNGKNPLVARVTVNRWWAELFGEGIVATLEDFGTMAQPPTHPKLLDWLAVEFVDSRWDMKHVLKVMVMSSTYRQSSKVNPETYEADPKNSWLARGPRFRMTAEMVRDNALAVSGMLSTKAEGEPIMPHQPTGIWRQVGRNEPKWIDETDEDRYRRGVYVIWRRAAPYPSFVNFDAPDRGSCVVSRPRTNTPLQALTLMNDPVYVELSLALANRLLSETPEASKEERIQHAFELVLSRPADKEELSFLEGVIRERAKSLSPEEVENLLGTDGIDYQPNEALDKTELAAWFYVASILLNLDETITKG
tara:strand:+ start:18952 stop:22038 length:3087 start_codon:yes stop_codon:yes gene_type:complete